MSELKPGHVASNDNVTLRYLEAGNGRPLLMLPAWSQSAEEYRFQLEGLSDHYRVIALDMRGHGDSDKPTYGYRISRMAKDVHEVMRALDLHDVTILGHSMGNSIIWCYWDLFGGERLSKIIIVDQSPMIVSNPRWSEEEKIAAGVLWDPLETTELANRFAYAEGPDPRLPFTSRMFNKDLAPELKELILACTVKMPLREAAALLYNHAHQDWRDVIPRITIPTLVIGGRVSNVPWRSQEWIASQIKGAKLRIFEEHEGGSHFMFIENPTEFNRLVAEFMA
jgi:non-heme chloroperoxidase